VRATAPMITDSIPPATSSSTGHHRPVNVKLSHMIKQKTVVPMNAHIDG